MLFGEDTIQTIAELTIDGLNVLTETLQVYKT